MAIEPELNLGKELLIRGINPCLIDQLYNKFKNDEEMFRGIVDETYDKSFEECRFIAQSPEEMLNEFLSGKYSDTLKLLYETNEKINRYEEQWILDEVLDVESRRKLDEMLGFYEEAKIIGKDRPSQIERSIRKNIGSLVYNLDPVPLGKSICKKIIDSICLISDIIEINISGYDRDGSKDTFAEDVVKTYRDLNMVRIDRLFSETRKQAQETRRLKENAEVINEMHKKGKTLLGDITRKDIRAIDVIKLIPFNRFDLSNDPDLHSQVKNPYADKGGIDA